MRRARGVKSTQIWMASMMIVIERAPMQNAGYRTSSGAQRKLQRVTEGQRLLVPDRRA